MDEASRSPLYDEKLQTFRVVLRHILECGELLPACSNFDLGLVQALGDVVRAVRDGSRTGDLVREARRAFAEYALRNEGTMHLSLRPRDVRASSRRAGIAQFSA
jgi:hypothetical protein